jgi:hypothetical protein
MSLSEEKPTCDECSAPAVFACACDRCKIETPMTEQYHTCAEHRSQVEAKHALVRGLYRKVTWIAFIAPDEKDAAQAKLARLGPRLGVYRHYKGPEYVLFALTLKEDTLEPMVHYYSLEKKTRWTRTYEDFTHDIEGNGLSRRFTYVRPATTSEIVQALRIRQDKLSQEDA